MAEERLKLENEYNELTKEVVQSCDKRKKEIEDGFAGERVINDRRLTALETEKQQLLRTMEEEKRSAKVQSETLQQTIEQCDILKRAIEDFGLNSKPKEYFEKRFWEIQGSIERISLKYFHDIDGKVNALHLLCSLTAYQDLEIVHEKLVAEDPSFSSVPIDDSDDSQDLRTAHA
ncbi:hypothetical protein V499_04270 [Pseudogymnoascus sp. VKM F-103]|uniref:Uncharacterized protein n=1 Tax=Pseudogymnoascus verrucosus TaxID=342668 RepID=A0A1B8GSP6_9PEZI|nr:uncharacterized protein VE01_03359 [Pseudogymnoascus verrucosus]KFY75765.1 hypothetical protein V499_04270 [Pseudogymnoascus sp. VKM F-103]OBT98830.1 hypothetical protein VE01_03359 [Pseudogymnoascus verrucosus]